MNRAQFDCILLKQSNPKGIEIIGKNDEKSLIA